MSIIALAALTFFAVMGGSAHTAGIKASPTPQAAPESAPPAATQAPASSPTPSPEPTPEPTPQSFEISLIGDITPDTVPMFKNTERAYQNVVAGDMSYVFAKTRDYFTGDDFTIANFECVLSDRDLAHADKNFYFKAPTSYTGMLADGSVEFVTLGNNHVLDYGEEGYADTKSALDAAGVAYAGRDEHTLYTTDSGLKIGVYAASFGTVEGVKAGIKALADEGAEFIIYAMHLGDEGSYDINSDQTAQAHAAIDAGADIVYGSHPHTLQPIEQYGGGYIFYSMGNWSFGGNTDPRDKDTFIAKLTVTRDTDGKVSVTEVTLIPCASSGVESGNNYQPVPYEEGGEKYTRTLSKLDGSFSGANLTIGYTYGVGELAPD